MGKPFELWGHPARLLLELEMSEGRRVILPLTNFDLIHQGPYGPEAVTIAFQHIHKVVDEGVDEAEFKGLA